jgi:hypothetical protein
MAYKLLAGKAWWRKMGKESFTLGLACLGLLAAIWFALSVDIPYGWLMALRIFLTAAVLLFWMVVEFDIIDFPYLKQGSYLTPDQQFNRFSLLLWLVLIALGLIAIWWLPEVSQWIGTLIFGGISLFILIALAKNRFYWTPLVIMLAAAGIAVGCYLWQPMAQVLTGLILVALGIVLEYLAVSGYASSETDYAYN